MTFLTIFLFFFDFFENFWKILDVFGKFWEQFGNILGHFWDIFGTFLGTFWEVFGNIFGTIWEDFLGKNETFFFTIKKYIRTDIFFN